MDTKSKVSIPYRLLTLLLAIILTITCVPDLTAFAGDSATGLAQGGATGSMGWGAYSHGYRFYIVDENGKLISNYIADVRDPNWQGYNENYDLDTTYKNLIRVGGTKVASIPQYNYDDVNANLPRCVISTSSGYAGQGAVLKNWLKTENTTKSGAKVSNLALICNKLWGKDAAILFSKSATQKAYFMVEPIFRTPIPKDSYGNYFWNRSYEGTWYGYMKTLSRKNSSGGWLYECPSGRGVRFIKEILGDGYCFSKDVKELGINEPPCKIDTLADSTLATVDAYAAGWGIQAFWNNIDKPQGDPISTYDIDNNPKKPETTEKPKNTDKIKNDADSAGRKNGEVEIVKLYGYAYKRKDWTNTTRRFVKVEQTDNRKNGDNKSIPGYFLRKKTTDKICKH